MGHWLPGNHRRSTKQQANRKCLKATLKTLFLYLIEAQLLENLVRMSTATTSEISGRIPGLKTTTSVSSSTTTTPTGPRTSSLLDSRVEDNHICVQFHFYHTNRAPNILLAGLPTPSSLLSSLLPFATAAGCHSKTAAKPRGWGGRWLEEPRVKSKISLFYVFNRGSIMASYYGSIFQ